ncbi:cytochrome C oxidase assembly protein [Sedimentitalea sp. CY04]|uniref:Cytochrome C oxidase assembly protein n=1 Tax=Parasedimentitalea denitrificans TaxID=2211118 RepID=A0ABX0W706_9RHOB|nr:cytochrome C oxidase assembly protein [Sedimentitalea sp. CY04]NIZ61451.1 cytochrome C oxidase assembly protein [Sedimentitalea sp. CY04]
MSFKPQHELHQRRFGRNMGVGLSLAAFVVLVLAMTIVKVTSGDFKFPQAQAAEQN